MLDFHNCFEYNIHTMNISDCRKTVFRNQARHGFMSVLFNIWNKMEKKA